jgi:hypothetical protein
MQKQIRECYSSACTASYHIRRGLDVRRASPFLSPWVHKVYTINSSHCCMVVFHEVIVVWADLGGMVPWCLSPLRTLV